MVHLHPKSLFVFVSAISDGSDAVHVIHQISRMVGRRLKQKYPRNRKPILDGRLLHLIKPSEDDGPFKIIRILTGLLWFIEYLMVVAFMS